MLLRIPRPDFRPHSSHLINYKPVKQDEKKILVVFHSSPTVTSECDGTTLEAALFDRRQLLNNDTAA